MVYMENCQISIGSVKEQGYAKDENKARSSQTFQTDRIRTD